MKFEDFLMVRCMEQTHALDDDLPDVYEYWVANLRVEEVIQLAEEWGESNNLVKGNI